MNAIDGEENFYDGSTGVPPQPDPPGDLDDDIEFGLVHSNNGGLRHSYGNTQWVALGLMLGASAENYATHREPIRKFLQAQIGDARQNRHRPQVIGYELREVSDPKSVDAMVSFGDADKPVQVLATIQATIGAGGGSVKIEIQKDFDVAFGSPTTIGFVEVFTSTDVSTLAFSDTKLVTFWVRPLEYVKFKKTGTGAITDPIPCWVTTPP